jgi:hypothetical protein
VNIAPYVQHVPTIEALIREHRIDTLVAGLGPTAWLLPWLDQSMIRTMRTFGCHDCFRIMPFDDVILMDGPKNWLHPDNYRGEAVLKARPKRFWAFQPIVAHWKSVLPPAVHSILQPVDWGVWNYQAINPHGLGKHPFKLVDQKPQTMAISPTGMTTLAWREGCRRIGVIGVDLMKGHHHMHSARPWVDAFFMRMAKQADELGGCVINLSPITSLKQFREWKPSTSGSAATSSNKPQEPSEFSNTASASTQPAP